MNERIALLCGLAAVVLWSTVATGFKLGLALLEPVQLLCLGSAISLAFFAATALVTGRLRDVTRLRPRQFLALAGLGLLNPALYYLVLFEAYDRLPAQVAQPLNYTWAIALTLLAVPILGQRVSTRMAFGIVLGCADLEAVKQWFGLQDFTAPVVNIDLRVGGTALYCMRSPEGEDFWSTGIYKEIVPQERIVATDSFADANGNVVPASHYRMDGEWPLELIVTVNLQKKNGKTLFILQHQGFPDHENRDLAEAGWNESLDKLASFLEGEM